MRKIIVFIYKVKDSRQSLVYRYRRLEPTTVTYIVKNVNEKYVDVTMIAKTDYFCKNIFYGTHIGISVG